MAALSRSDAERLLRFVAEAESVGGDEPFTGDVLVELGKLVEADWITFCELDRVRKRFLGSVDRSGDEDTGGADDEVFWQIVINEHPVCVEHQRGVPDALKLSDFLSFAELRRTRLYDVWFRPAGVRHELNIAIPSPLWHTKTFLFDRGDRRDFTERDRLVLDLLRPHLARLYEAARLRRLLGAAFNELETASPAEPRGAVFLDCAGNVEFASPPAQRLLREYFGWQSGSSLPPAVRRWLHAGSGPLEHRRGTGALSVERSNGALLLTERQAAVQLTAREREVLAWVARGKTNPEIAELLWLAPSTVRKHLENVFAKLGVKTRTAAVTRFLGLLDAETA